MRLRSKLSVEEKRLVENMIFVGRLATEAELTLTLIENPIQFSDTSNMIRFYIKCLSEIPQDVAQHFEYQNKIFMANTNSYDNAGLMRAEGVDMDVLHYIDLRDQVPRLFEGKLIYFKLSVRDNKIYANMQKLEEKEAAQKYISLPSPKLHIADRMDDLHKKLVDERRPIQLDYYPNILFPPPTLIKFEHMVYQVKFENKGNPNVYYQDELTSVKCLELSDDDLEYFIDLMYDDQLYYVSDEKYEALLAKMQTEGVFLEEVVGMREQVTLPQEEGVLASVRNEPSSEQVAMAHQSEINFLQKLTYISQLDYQLFHRKEDLINMHTSIKTNPITILGGMSGTGKSQLARAYADALELAEGNLAFIPISPSYQEPEDILGYLNPQTGMYHESDTGLVDLLMRAEEDPNNLYMVIFDEMNLAQVEHWFSPFLSLLESTTDRTLHLYNKNNRVINGDYKPTIKLNDNVIFVGTVNFDETTKNFSDRLLDRVNMIVPEKMSFAEAGAFYEAIERENLAEKLADLRDMPINNLMMRDAWMYEKNAGINDLTEAEINVLDELHRMINEQDPQKGVSFRIALGIVNFITNLPTEGAHPKIDRGAAFDYQINQRILTKINGIDSFVSPLVGDYMNGSYEAGEITSFLQSDACQQVSNFEKSLATLRNKAKELSVYGFAN